MARTQDVDTIFGADAENKRQKVKHPNGVELLRNHT
jgi:hypothetical protein